MPENTRLPLLDRIAASRFALPKPRPWSKRTLRIPMSDGVELGADLYTPSGPSKGLLLSRGPYGRGVVISLMTARMFAAQGYTVLFASTRGTADSGGVLDPMRDEVRDGIDLVAWMREQPWFPGRFATVGGSYLGHTQWAMLADPPPELVASVITMGPHDFSRHFWGTGSFNYDLLGWSQQVAEAGGDTNVLRGMIAQASAVKKIAPIKEAVPVLPAADEFFGAQGKPWLHEMLIRPDLDDPHWEPMQHAGALEKVTTPTLIHAGWQDIFLPQSIVQYRRLRERGVDVALTVGAWTHIDLMTAQRVMGPQSLDWLDAHLAGQPLRRAAPVHVEVTGAKRWIDLPDWPAAGTSDERLYLHAGRRLAASIPPADAADAGFTYDPADPTPEIGGNQIAGGYKDDTAYAARKDVLVYDSDPLPADLTVLGAPTLRLAHRTSLPDADLFVRISDVDAKGRSRNVTEVYRRVAHGGENLDAAALPLYDAAHTFRAGHRIRLIVAGGSFPQFARNPGTGENPLTATELKPNRHTVRHADGASELVLPVGFLG